MLGSLQGKGKPSNVKNSKNPAPRKGKATKHLDFIIAQCPEEK